MKSILCFGDSITWGMNPSDWSRFDFDKTWSGILQKNLGNECRVITEGLSGRTTCWDLPYLPYRSGKEFLPMILESHSPLDLVIILLGINDLILTLDKTAEQSAWGIMSLVRVIVQSDAGPNGSHPKILIVSPPALGKLSNFMKMSYEGNQDESMKLAECYKAVAESTGCEFLNAASIVKASAIDGVHPDENGHRILGEAISKKVLSMNL